MGGPFCLPFHIRLLVPELQMFCIIAAMIGNIIYVPITILEEGYCEWKRKVDFA